MPLVLETQETATGSKTTEVLGGQFQIDRVNGKSVARILTCDFVKIGEEEFQGKQGQKDIELTQEQIEAILKILVP